MRDYSLAFAKGREMKKKLLLALALLAASLMSSVASSSALRSCDTACPTADGFCNCPKWTDRPGVQTFCGSWNRVGGCWYE
jgi:hypothetical protein